jgi:hypothetical protein
MGQSFFFVIDVLCILDGVTAVVLFCFFNLFAGRRRSLRLAMSDAQASNTSGS